jgi:succinate-semialdehyde dehydrogenase / glutarate-semialdehyde dehydrogenase
MYADLALYIDGEWLAGGGRDNEPAINPATEKPLATLTHASPADLDRALAAEKGYRTWRGTAPFERARVMRKAADLIREPGGNCAHLDDGARQDAGRGACRSRRLRRYH